VAGSKRSDQSCAIARGRLFEPGKAFGRGEAAERIAHLCELAFERSERRAIGAGCRCGRPRSANARTSVFERLDRPARHGIGQRPRDIRENRRAARRNASS